jgi:hypothetical protein
VTSTSASFAFASSDSGSTFECKLDGGAYAACTSPKAYSGLVDGSHTFTVRATDAAGNVDASPATRSWTVQSPAADHQPAAAYAYNPSSPTAGQAVAFDASTATCQDTPCTYTWEDHGSDGAGGTQWPLGTGKTMSFTFQDPGVKNVRVTVADADGDTDSTMKAVTVAPASPPADATAPDTTITSGPTGTTNDSTPTFAFTSTETGSTFRCRVDSGSWATCTSPWTTSTLADSSHTVTVRATDAAGNTDATPASRTFTVDTQAPSTTINSAPPALSPGSSATVAFSSNESAASFECQLDGGAWTACMSPKTYTGLTLGGHTASVRATDAASNVDATPDSASWTSIALLGGPAAAPAPRGTPGSANQAPTVKLAAPTAGSTFSSTLSMAASATDDHGVQRVEFWVDGTRVARDGAAPYAATYAAGRSTSYGVHTVTVRAFDAAGLARSAAVTVSRVRAAAPSRGTTATSSKPRARAASASSDDRQNMLVAVSMWRIASAPADGAGTLLRGRGMPGRSATVSLTRCGDTSGAIAAVMELSAGADGTLYARQATDGLCILRVRPFGNS